MGQPEIRDKIIRGWGLQRACEGMGLGDVMALLWAECEAVGGMHFCGQRSVAVELIDPASGAVLPWEEGARGEAVYTTFAREATPVLRYRSADLLVVTAMSCPCGRTSSRIRCVGRIDDMLIYKAMNVFPSSIRNVVMRGFPGAVEPYLRIWKDHPDQVRYDTPIPVDVEAAPGLPADRYQEVARAIERELRTRLQIRADVSIVDPETLPRTSYKTPLLRRMPRWSEPMSFRDACIPVRLGWSSPFAGGRDHWPSSPASTWPPRSPPTRWLASACPPPRRPGSCFGWTVPQPEIFYGASILAARIGAPHATGAMLSQACATSAACLEAAALRVETGLNELSLVITTDRTSNGPVLTYPAPSAPGGAPRQETWVLDNSAAIRGAACRWWPPAERVAALCRDVQVRVSRWPAEQGAHRYSLFAHPDQGDPAPDGRQVEAVIPVV